MIDICPICQIATPCDCDDHEETNVGKLMHAGAKLAMRIGQLEAQNHQLREALQKARNTLAGLGYASIAADICDPALGEKK